MFKTDFSEVFRALVFSALVVAIACIAWLWSQNGPNAGRSQEILPSQLGFVMGQGEVGDNGIQVTGYQDGYALLSSGAVEVSADELFLLHLDIEAGDEIQYPDEAPAFFWRTEEVPGQIHRITLGGDNLVDLSISENWLGQVVEYGFLFNSASGSAARLNFASLSSESLGNSIRLVPREWFEFEPWSKRSVNFLFGGAPNQKLPLPMLGAAWVLLAALFWRFGPGQRHTRPVIALMLISLAGWMLVDVRWTYNRWLQMDESMEKLSQLTVNERISDSVYGKYFDYLVQIKDKHLGASPSRLLIIPQREEAEVFVLRARYHLLPHSTDIRSALRNELSINELDYVLFLGDFGGVDSVAVNSGQAGLPIGERWKSRLELVEVSAEGILFQVR